MEKLLKWSIQSAEHDPSKGPAPRPDEKALNELFGGADEATQMKDAVAAALSKDIDVDNREIALDNLEMLVENLDNANNLENMGLWEPLLSLLDDPSPTIRKMTCWVAGTATQNNEKSQIAFSSKEGAIAKLVQIVKEDPDQEVQLKALYAISSSVGHCQPAYEQFESAKGWEMLEYLFQTVNHSKLRMRILSFLQVVCTVDPVEQKFEHLKKTSIVESLVKIMEEVDHVDAEEKALYVCSTLQSHGYKFTDDQAQLIGKLRKKIIDKSEGGVHPDDVPFSH